MIEEEPIKLWELKKQLSYLKELSAIYGGDNIYHDIILIDRIIDFVEKSNVEKKYIEDVWHIKAELYHLKEMISNMHIFTPLEIKKEVNEIIEYANKHL